MPLQRINVGYGGLRIDGNLQVVTDTANVYLGNVTYPLGSVFASNITTTGANGNALVINGGSIVPSANLVRNLGTSTLYFGTAFVGQYTGNGATIGASGVSSTGNIAVNTATAAAITTSTTVAEVFNASATTLKIGGAATTISLGAASADTLTYNATSGSLIPGANNAVNLGSASAYWGTTFTGQVTANTAILNAGTGNAVVATGVITPSANLNTNLGTSSLFFGTAFAGQITANALTIGAGGATLSGSLVPSANVTQNLGSSTAYWGTTFTGQVTANTAVLNAGTGNAVVATGKVYVAGDVMPLAANATYNLGSSGSWWNTFYGVSTQAKYADVAENYLADRPYPAGTVLEFGGEAEVTISTQSTTRIAGVVSSNPAHLMNGALQGPNVVPVALLGRVPCQVIGPVTKGDLMVSAGFGFAKTNNNPQPGQVIGKALEEVTGQNKAIIEVVVGRV